MIMDNRLFLVQIERLKNQWPHGNWSPEKMRSIWDLVKFIDISWLEGLVTIMLANHRTAPQVKDFKNAVHVYHSEKRAAESLFEKPDDNRTSIFSEEERKEMWKTVMDIATGKLSKKDARLFQDAVQSALDAHYKFNCKVCFDKGEVFANRENYSYIFRCSCSKGQTKPDAWPVYNPMDRRYVIDDHKIR